MARTIRITIASVKTEIEIAGSTNWLRFERVVEERRVDERGHPAEDREVKSRSRVASQKLGMLIPISPATREA